MIWMSGLDMGCFYFNRAWLDCRGRASAQENGSGWAEGVHEQDLDRCVNFYIACFEQRSPFAMSYRLKDAAGAYQTILDRGAHYDEDGKFLGYFGGCAVLHDQSPLASDREVGRSLQPVAQFALDLARRQAGVRHPGQTVAARALRHAVAQLNQLSRDMVAYQNIGPAECLK